MLVGVKANSYQAIRVFVRLPDLPQRRLHVVTLPRKRSKNATGHAERHD